MTKTVQTPKPPSDLLTAARAGDRAAFEALVSRNRSRIRAIAASRWKARIVLGVTADDVHQETLLRALKSIATCEGRDEEAFLRWLGGIAENVVLELARKKARDRTVPIDGPLAGSAARELAADVPSPSKALRRDERFERLAESLACLSPDHREAVLLVRVQGLDFKEAGKRMGRSPNAVKQLLYRALRELKETFGDTESLHLPDRSLGPGGKEDQGR